MEQWIVGSPPSENYPYWTRANVGEVFPDPVVPLTYDLVMLAAESGWRDALVRMGAFTHDEFTDGIMEPLGIFGGYCYLNVSVARLIGERGPGTTAQDMDDFFGAMPGMPPYVAADGDQNEDRTAAISATFDWVMTTPEIDFSHTTAARMDQIHRDRPDLDAMSNQQLWEYARDIMLANFQPIFAEHIYITFLAPIPVGAIGQICAALERPNDTMKVISGVGDVESAAPAMALWELGRLVANEPDLMAAFDVGTPAGLETVLDRIRQAGPTSEPFLAGFDEFIDKFGCRGPNEWEIRVHTWETRPALALAAIDRMRLSDDDAAPAARNAAMAADRERVVAEISEALAGDAETLGTFQAATKAAAIFNAGRERTKTNCVKFIHEARMAMHTIGRRMVADGHCDDSGDFSLLFVNQIEDWFENPASYRDTIRERKTLFDEYMALQEPFVFDSILSDPNTWSSRADFQVEPVAVGDVLDGISGCPGSATGIARVITDPVDPTALGPGEVLVAPSTDPSWTPLFVPAAAVIVDVGSPVSHAIIVSRELGIPCVPSVTNASRRIPDGTTVEVNGDTGKVTILALP